MSLINEFDDYNKITFEDKIKLKKDILKMSKQNCITILQYIMQENINFTENSNGIFFNLKLLNNLQIKELINLVNELKNKTTDENTETLITIPSETEINNLHHKYEKYIQQETNL